MIRAATACKPVGLNRDEQTGYNIVLRACRSPLTWIAENAGKPGSLFCEKVVAANGNYGYNAAADRFEDLVAAGVIDPAKVVRCALENAASVATLLLTSERADRGEAKRAAQRTRPRQRHVLVPLFKEDPSEYAKTGVTDETKQDAVAEAEADTEERRSG